MITVEHLERLDAAIKEQVTELASIAQSQNKNLDGVVAITAATALDRLRKALSKEIAAIKKERKEDSDKLVKLAHEVWDERIPD